MTPKQEKCGSAPPLVQRRGFYLDLMKYRETQSVSLPSEQCQRLLDVYEKLKSPLGYVSYTEIARALSIPPLEVMQHVKYMHIHSREWAVRFSNNRHNENVFFKLLKRP